MDAFAKRIGNNDAASDLYGLGIRIGLYLQGFSFVINSIFARPKERSSQVLPTVTIVFALLCSQSILAQDRSISPAELLVTINLTAIALGPALLLIVVTRMNGQATALLLTIIGMIFSQIINLWFWFGGHQKLPLFGTQNLTPIDYVPSKPTAINGSGSHNMKTIAILYFILSILLLVGPSSVRWWLMAVRYCQGRVERDVTMVEWAQDSTYIIFNGSARAKEATIKGSILILAFIALPIMINTVEKLIDMNDLTPNNELNSPGQLIPLITGVVVMVDSVVLVVGLLVRTLRGAEEADLMPTSTQESGSV